MNDTCPRSENIKEIRALLINSNIRSNNVDVPHAKSGNVAVNALLYKLFENQSQLNRDQTKLMELLLINNRDNNAAANFGRYIKRQPHLYAQLLIFARTFNKYRDDLVNEDSKKIEEAGKKIAKVIEITERAVKSEISEIMSFCKERRDQIPDEIEVQKREINQFIRKVKNYLKNPSDTELAEEIDQKIVPPENIFHRVALGSDPP